MARSAFVDTSAWYALIDRSEASHRTASDIVARVLRDQRRLVTTDYVLDETVTLSRARSGSHASHRLLDLVHATSALDIEWVGSERFHEAERIFRKHHDQPFSFTDCTSFVVMRELGIREAITSDDHFRVAGFEVLR